MKRFFATAAITAVPVFLVAALATLTAEGQTTEKHIHSREQLWIGYFNQTRLNDRWGFWTDIHYRRTDNFVDRPFQILLRPAVTYYIKDNLRVNVGSTFARHFAPKGLATARNEHRPWQQIWWAQKYPGFTTRQSLRTEQRFIERVVNDVKIGGYHYHFRVRYNFAFLIPLKGKDIKAKTPFATVTNEVFLNFGDRIVYNTFDQNRVFGGVGYQITEHMNIQLGYMNIYQQESSGNNYFSTHTIRLFFFHNLDYRSNDH